MALVLLCCKSSSRLSRGTLFFKREKKKSVVKSKKICTNPAFSRLGEGGEERAHQKPTQQTNASFYFSSSPLTSPPLPATDQSFTATRKHTPHTNHARESTKPMSIGQAGESFWANKNSTHTPRHLTPRSSYVHVMSNRTPTIASLRVPCSVPITSVKSII